MLRRTLRQPKVILGGLFLLGIFFLGGILVLTPGPVFAQAPDLGLSYGAEIGLTSMDIRVVIARIIQVFLGLLGILAVGLIIYAGYLWMTSQGNEEIIIKARQIIVNAVIGLAIILSAFAIVSFVISALLEGTLGISSTAGLPGGNGFAGVGVGSSNLESHYPPRDATGIPRNTKLAITFKVPVAVTTIIDTSDAVWNTANCQGVAVDAVCGKLVMSGSGANQFSNVSIFPTTSPTAILAANKIRVITLDNKTFVFKPLDLLGSAEVPTDYTVILRNRILTGQGAAVFGATGLDYNWRFQVSTIIDLTPPRVSSVVPVASAREPRNTIVEITFNEPVDPITVTGSAAKFGVWLGSQAGSRLGGVNTVSNGYRTVEFITNTNCGVGKNSCGQDVFCLPGEARIMGRAIAARLSSEPPASVEPPDGVADMAGNSLDGDGDGITEGPAVDTYEWVFNTTNDIDLVPPTVEAMLPGPNANGVSPTSLIKATFSKIVRSASITTNSFRLFYSGQIFPGNFSVGISDTSRRQAYLKVYAPYLEINKTYWPEISSEVQDTRQNCYFPCAAQDTACTGARWNVPPYPSCKL